MLNGDKLDKDLKTPSEVPNESLDDIFIETEWTTKWQMWMLLLSTLSIVHTGMFVIAPSFFRVKVPVSCVVAQCPEAEPDCGVSTDIQTIES